jgi:broad specificity phosphatase PhoE
MRSCARAAAVLVCLVLLLPGPASAQEAVFVVRHAERVDASSDSKLSAAGEARAARLAAVLKDAGITHIYTTDLQRTIQTAAPLAAALHITPSALPSADQTALIARLHEATPRDRILVVGHSNTVPGVLAALGVTPAITIGDSEYDNLFVIVPVPGTAPRLLRLHF